MKIAKPVELGKRPNWYKADPDIKEEYELLQSLGLLRFSALSIADSAGVQIALVPLDDADEEIAAHIVHCVNTHETRERILRHISNVEGDERNTKKELLQILDWVRGEARAAVLAKTKETK